VLPIADHVMRGDLAAARPGVYSHLEAEDHFYAIPGESPTVHEPLSHKA
jgi:hypothetical protein